MDAEARVVDWLNASGIGATAYPDVPAARPESFVTVLRTGGGRSDLVVERPLMLAQCWAPDRPRACVLAAAVGDALRAMEAEPDVFHVSVTSTYRDVDLESGQPRCSVVFEPTFND